MRISELARLTGVSPRSIRHYEAKGLLSPVRSGNNYREFSPDDVPRVKAIQLYLKLGLTTGEIRQLFEGEVVPPNDYAYCEEMLAIYQAKLDRVNEQLEALLDLRRMLERQIRLTIGKAANGATDSPGPASARCPRGGSRRTPA